MVTFNLDNKHGNGMFIVIRIVDVEIWSGKVGRFEEFDSNCPTSVVLCTICS